MSKKLIDELFPGFSERSARGKRNRAKGTDFERRVANAFKAVWPRARRLHGQARDGGEAPDVGGTPFWIECSKGTTSIHAKIAQGIADAERSPSEEYRGLPPLVVSHRKGREPALVTMRLEDFLALFED